MFISTCVWFCYVLQVDSSAVTADIADVIGVELSVCGEGLDIALRAFHVPLLAAQQYAVV